MMPTFQSFAIEPLERGVFQLRQRSGEVAVDSELLTPEENMAFNAMIPIIASIKTKGVK